MFVVVTSRACQVRNVNADRALATEQAVSASMNDTEALATTLTEVHALNLNAVERLKVLIGLNTFAV